MNTRHAEQMSTAILETFRATTSGDPERVAHYLERVSTEATCLCLRCNLLEYVLGELLWHEGVRRIAEDAAPDVVKAADKLLTEIGHVRA